MNPNRAQKLRELILERYAKASGSSLLRLYPVQHAYDAAFSRHRRGLV